MGKDIAGHTIPFQENSKEQANVILWYQDKKLELRVAGNYRSERAVAQDYGGITGFEEYQDSTFYVDASASYAVYAALDGVCRRFQPHEESEHYYLVWPDLRLNTTQFETRYAHRRARQVLTGRAPLASGRVAAGLDGHRR